MTRNKQNNLSFLITILLYYYKTSGQFIHETEQREFAPKHLIHNLNETTAQNIIILDDVVKQEKFDDNELRKLFVRKFGIYKNISGVIRNEYKVVQRKLRAAYNASNGVLNCLFCTGWGNEKSSENCYNGAGTNIAACRYNENCYTELHPQYIKRGCVLPGAVNRTFVCKCPLCNDKPYDSTIYYEYTGISDWEYDNERLQKPIRGVDLICKVCETTGTNKVADNTCKLGQNVNLMVCRRGQLCYTTVVEESGYVSRGCISTPVYNSMFYICNDNLCNNEDFVNPTQKKPIYALHYAEPRSRPIFSNAQYIGDRILFTVILINLFNILFH